MKLKVLGSGVSSEVGKAKPLFKSVFVLLLGRRKSVTFIFLGWAGLTCKPCLFFFFLRT